MCDELEKIANGEFDVTYDREIKDISDYVFLGKKYCEDNGIRMEETWDFR